MTYAQTHKVTSRSKQDRSIHETEVDQKKKNKKKTNSCRNASFDYETQTAINYQICLYNNRCKNKQNPKNSHHTMCSNCKQPTRVALGSKTMDKCNRFYQHVRISMTAEAGQTGHEINELNEGTTKFCFSRILTWRPKSTQLG